MKKKLLKSWDKARFNANWRKVMKVCRQVTKRVSKPLDSKAMRSDPPDRNPLAPSSMQMMNLC